MPLLKRAKRQLFTSGTNWHITRPTAAFLTRLGSSIGTEHGRYARPRAVLFNLLKFMPHFGSRGGAAIRSVEAVGLPRKV